MIDINQIPNETLVARGAYSTVRAAHEDSKKALSMLCGQLTSAATQLLRKMQPDNDEVPEDADSLLDEARNRLELMAVCVNEIRSLARQRKELKPDAWGKK